MASLLCPQLGRMDWLGKLPSIHEYSTVTGAFRIAYPLYTMSILVGCFQVGGDAFIWHVGSNSHAYMKI